MEENVAPNPRPPVELDPIEARIIGCLVEKAAATPEAYPLTENAIVVACNQKTSREPVMQLEPGTVAHALRALEGKGLIKVASSSQRALRYEHRFDATWGTTARQRAVLCVMLLRGPQTLAELHARTDRLAEFPSLDDVRDTVERLIQREPALVVRVPRAHGQREDRYMHLLGGPVDVGELAAAAPASPASSASRADLAERVERLEADLSSLRDAFEAFRARVGDG
ncbi:YceH family protein [Dokdonella sp.]|uniref:YceH family protein n=1 Tax=Dokdonella sp. TaxID=2291710 RepID=UPI002F3FDE64